MNTAHIAQLLTVAQLAIDLHKARNAVRNAKHAYYEVLEAHQEEHGQITDRLDPNRPDHYAILSASGCEYAIYQAAKRTAYNIQRRLANACRKVAA